MIAYAISFAQCAAVIFVFESAQPVLLYIVPCLFTATFLTAMRRGELRIIYEADLSEKQDVLVEQEIEEIKEIKENEGN